MKIIILQHIGCETPGYIKDLMIRDNFDLTTIQLDKGDLIPRDLSIYDAMFCMGGPMDTWMEKKYPWLANEKKKIKEFVIDLQKPFIGFCLGCQLLGEVVGGNVINSKNPEIGILEVNLSEEKKTDKLFCDFPKSLKVLQWHSYEVTGLENNENIKLLASSPITKYQIFKYKNHAYGIQFHIEIKNDTVNEWGCVPEYKNALESSLGKNALNIFNKSALENMKNMNFYAEILYRNFVKNIKK